jgi:hypothetical protein
MAIIGGRAHNLDLVHEVAKLGYPFAEISIYDADEMHRQADDFLALKEKYGIYYLAHYPNEGNPFDARPWKRISCPR